jgi:YidC/Oxa1 family membrane protein insertase
VIGYISDNLLLPILDFFYGLVPSYGLAIIALTVVIRLALFPLSAGSIRSARRMRIAQPVMQKRQAEIKAKYANNPQKQQEELGTLMKEFGSPLSGCLPLLVQMPILFALFATLRGSPFADVPYTLNLKVLPAEQIAAVEPKPFNSPSHSIFVTATNHVPVVATLEKGNKLGVGDIETVSLHTKDGSSFASVLSGVENGSAFTPTWSVTKGEGLASVDQNGTIHAIAPGDVTVEAKIPGLAARSGFLFIKALGQVGFYTDGAINWDIARQPAAGHGQQDHARDDHRHVPVLPAARWRAALHGGGQHLPGHPNLPAHPRGPARQPAGDPRSAACGRSENGHSHREWQRAPAL